MVARDLDAIAREIEVTRAELAEAIDAIAEKMSPKRAATRGRERVKTTVAELRGDTQHVDGSTYSVQRQLRTDRVALVASAVTAAAVVIAVVRRSRRRRRARASADVLLRR